MTAFVLASVAVFLAAFAGAVVAWVWTLGAWLKLRKRMTAFFPGQWEDLQVWDGIKMTGSNALFGMEGGTPAMWGWLWKKDPLEPEDVRVLKARCRKGATVFLACWATGMAAMGACMVASRVLPAE